MSRQKTRMGSEGNPDPALAETKKARHRLVGAIALCLLAAIVVPMLLESEPRNGARELPITVETAFESTRPDRPWIEPPPLAEDDGTPSASDRIVMLEQGAGGHAVPDEAPATPSHLEPAPVTPLPPQEPARQTRPAPPPAHPPQQPQAPARPAPQRPPAPAQEDRPDVLGRLIDRVDQPAAGQQAGAGQRPPAERRVVRRFLVQVGAYSNVKSARLATERVGKAGLTAYQETVKTANGDWIRVRVGPFGSREEAEQAQAALKRAGVTAALIAL